MALIKFDPPPGTRTHPCLDSIRMMTEEEFAGLVWSVKRMGLIQPISVDNEGVILDGRNRLMACLAAGVEPKFETINTDDPVHFMCQKNILRGDCSPGQKALQNAIFSSWFPDYPHRPIPEAVLVAQHDDLRAAVLKGTMDLGSAHKHMLERQEAAARAAEQAERLEHLRVASPYLAIQVDEGKLTLEDGEAALGQAVAVAEEKAAAPMLAEHATVIRAIGKRIVADIIEIGQRLTECKAMLRHGNWLGWLDREFGWSEMTALRFMQVHELGKSNNLLDSHLPMSGLYLLARPSTPEAVRDNILKRDKSGEAFSVAEIKKAIDTVRGSAVKSVSRTQALRDLCEKMVEANDPFVEELRRLLPE
jgi:hypothetical protein